MTAHAIEDVQQVMLNALQEFHEFCLRNQLRYYLIGGSLIGAVRHQGPIPWDDDIDIGMPRSDYLRFQKLSSEFSPSYRVSYVGGDAGYIYPFSKVYDVRTSVTEVLCFEFTRGVWLDVFPLDGTFQGRAMRTFHLWLARLMKGGFATVTGAYVPKDCSRAVRSVRACIRWVAKPVPVGWIHSALHSFLALKSFEASTHVANLLGRWGAREVSRREVFEAAVPMQFANHEFLAPVGYDEYLRGVYGDYMRLPPEAARVPAHSTGHISLVKSFID
ncbi:TPA: LicD family protein [Stenotrophomonas maltophilia]|uniref:LicD family protein n=1 Tax=Stenotrophomonas geniculata TaxID=86188 RepID=UPI002A93730F|nr:LicD family protein [Stenotrophomonas maltophilia]MBN5091059.1 LicD family protein [Stenotrophomonas maltophilia]HEL3156810.1 LicD family protein [Stenotrophomonas maltophilia]